jgi:tetratricopeptide (TPR) repeat protein
MVGDPRWPSEAESILRVATEAKDEQALAWAINWKGVRHFQRGELDAAVKNFESAIRLYESVPDYRWLPGALAQLGLCLIVRGEVEKPLQLLRRSESIRHEYHVSGLFASYALVFAADAYLRAAEMTRDRKRREEMISHAKRLAAQLRSHGRRVHDGSAAEAMRVTGILEWLVGNHEGAVSLWEKGIVVAERMTARLALARLHNELGVRVGRQPSVDFARQLLDEAGVLSRDTRCDNRELLNYLI